MGGVVQFPKDRWVHHFDTADDLMPCKCDSCETWRLELFKE